MAKRQAFISYSGGDTAEASLLQFALETLLSDEEVIAWTYARSQWVNYEAGMAMALDKPIVIIGRKGIGKSALFAALGNVDAFQIEG